MQRTALGVIAFSLLAFGAAGAWFASEGPLQTTSSICLRAGILLTVIWIALPDLRKLPVWLMVSLLAGVVATWYLMGRYKAVIPFALGAIAMLALLRPRSRMSSGRRRK
jgi:hypothetical protein